VKKNKNRDRPRFPDDGPMSLELYHSVNSVCAQKVRVALAEKGLEYESHLMTLRGDQFDPAYMKLNPNAVVPTLVHDGRIVIESSVILYYLDEAFPSPALMPRDPLAYAQKLYAALRELDSAGCAEILIEAPPEAPEWAAVGDRLKRACG